MPKNFIVTAAAQRTGRHQLAYLDVCPKNPKKPKNPQKFVRFVRILRGFFGRLNSGFLPKALKKAEDAQAIYVSTFGKNERLRGYPGQRPGAAWGARFAPHRLSNPAVRAKGITIHYPLRFAAYFGYGVNGPVLGPI